MKITYREFEGEIEFEIGGGFSGRDTYVVHMTRIRGSNDTQEMSFTSLGYTFKDLIKDIKKEYLELEEKQNE